MLFEGYPIIFLQNGNFVKAKKTIDIPQVNLYVYLKFLIVYGIKYNLWY